MRVCSKIEARTYRIIDNDNYVCVERSSDGPNRSGDTLHVITFFKIHTNLYLFYYIMILLTRILVNMSVRVES